MPRLEWKAWFGARGERVAARDLRRRGHVILTRNYRCPVGEIDLVTLDGPNVVFVEVKTRSDEHHGDIADAVSSAKWSRVERAARVYLLKHPFVAERPCRFDLVTIVWPKGGRRNVEHHPDAYHSRRA